MARVLLCKRIILLINYKHFYLFPFTQALEN
jgi:hypothetical protein